jgi:RNA polymerase sigma-70 factor (ECF subfamily)
MEFERLLAELKNGKEKAQQQLFAQQGKAMYALCRRYLSPAEEAEEAMMNGFLKVFSCIGQSSFANEAALAGWMRRIMVNECLQQLRKAHSFLILADAKEESHPTESTMETKMEAKELFALMEKLPAGYRTVFNLYVIEGYTHAEIAKLMQISEGASKSQLSKARQKLAQLWKQKNAYYGMGKAR